MTYIFKFITYLIYTYSNSSYISVRTQYLAGLFSLFLLLITNSNLIAADGPTSPVDLSRQSFNPEEGAEQITKLSRINLQIEAGRHTIESMTNNGWIKQGPQRVIHKKQQNPFSVETFPLAHTGIYIHQEGVQPLHKAIIILLPGLGTIDSNALSLLDIGGVLHKTKKSRNRGAGSFKNPLNTMNNGQKVRFAAFPTDLPLNGLGRQAPFAFGSPEAIMQSIRHVHLILSLRYPNLPVYIAGRSQGGLAAITYAQRYHDVAGVIAVNPSHPNTQIIRGSVRIHEDPTILGEIWQGVKLDPKTWTAYKTFTSQFRLEQRSAAPTLIMLGDADLSYPKHNYLFAFRKFVQTDRNNRGMVILEKGEHNLWNLKDVPQLHRVVSLMGEFLLQPASITNPQNDCQTLSLRND